MIGDDPLGAPPVAGDRRIVHVDMDAFFAAVEKRDRPALRDRPVIVGRDLGGRGVVAAADYLARRSGVRSGMPYVRARALCPGAEFVIPRMERYLAVSAQLAELFRRFTPLVEQLSLDEAWLDVTEQTRDLRGATALAADLRALVRRETGLTCSAGISHNKLLAKMSSKRNKPDGQFTLPAADVTAFLERSELRALYGIGEATARRLAEVGITSVRALWSAELDQLERAFGRSRARALLLRARGVDKSPVQPRGEAKSASVERTFESDVRSLEALLEALPALSARLAERLPLERIRPRRLTVHVTGADRERLTRSVTVEGGVDSASRLLAAAREQLAALCSTWRPARAIGLKVAGFARDAAEPFGPQLSLPSPRSPVSARRSPGPEE
jgi:DNA polymerase-4